MNKQILSLAFALPAILASTVPALADTPVQVVMPVVQPQVTVPQVQTPIQQGFVNPMDRVITKGPGGNTVTPKGPRPPKRDVDGIIQFQNGKLSQPAGINQNINAAPVQGL
jgi:hypothetical protein